MKLLFSIVTTSMACGFFAGRFVSGPFCWAIGGALVAMIGYWWIKAEMEIAPEVKEEDLA